jgi:hypothetical protein
MPNNFGTGSNSNGQFWYGSATNFPGFLYKKNIGVGVRRSTKFAAGGNIVTNNQTYLYNKWKPGVGGVGASTISNRRAKNRLATICKENKCFPCYMTLGQYSNYTHNPNGVIPCPPFVPPLVCIPNLLNVPIPSGAPLNNDAAKVLVLACIDPRFINALQEYLIQQLGTLGYSYDLFTLAGASLGGNGGGICNYTHWQEVLFQHIEVGLSLHNIQYIWIFDHLDCGAYQNCVLGGNDSLTEHNNQFTTLKNTITANTFTLADGSTKNFLASDISGFVIPLDGCFLDMPAPNAPTGICEYIPPSQGARVLVLGCIDPRFNAILSSFLVNYKDVKFIYDLFILAGASLGANQSYLSFPNTLRSPGQTIGTPYPLNQIPQWGQYWGPSFFDTLALAIQLHNITEVWVFDHFDCGAYKLIKYGNFSASDNALPPHVEELTKLEGFIAQTAPNLGFKGFVADMNGNILKVVDNHKGIC